MINPLGFPNRIKLNQLIFSAAEIIACYAGKPANATSFTQKDNIINDLVKKLNSMGLNEVKRVMHCGLTGK